jgi:lysophospholipase L1-like esterase
MRIKTLTAITFFFFCSLARAGNDHLSIRMAIASLQVSTIGQGNILLLGDSLMEQFWWNQIGGKPVLNGGVGDSGVDQVLETAKTLIPISKPKIVVIMVGVNDCITGQEKSPSNWAEKYSQILDLIHKAGATPIALSVLPVEKGKNLGDGYFDSECIRLINSQWEKIVTSRNERHVNLTPYFIDAAGHFYMRSGWTVDGVHLNGTSSRVLYSKIEGAIVDALKK